MSWSAIKEPVGRRKGNDNRIRRNEAVPPPPCTLLFLDYAGDIPEGTEHRLVASKISLGRGETCTISYGDDYPMVSRVHAAIEWGNNNYYLRHLSETNQTLLNGRPINRKWFLQDNDVIQLAPSGPKLRFNTNKEVSPSPADEPVSPGKKNIDIYQVALVVVVTISVSLIAWVAWLMMYDS